MKVLSETSNKNITLFEVKYSDGIKRILIPRVIWEGFKEAISYGHCIGGKGEFVNEEDFSDDDFPSTENYLKKFHKAFKIKTEERKGVQIWRPDLLGFNMDLLCANDSKLPEDIKNAMKDWYA